MVALRDSCWHMARIYLDCLDYQDAQPVIYLQDDRIVPPLLRGVNAGHGHLVDC